MKKKKKLTDPLLIKRWRYIKEKYSSHVKEANIKFWSKIIRLNRMDLYFVYKLADALHLRKYSDDLVIKLLQLDERQLFFLKGILKDLSDRSDPNSKNTDCPFSENYTDFESIPVKRKTHAVEKIKGGKNQKAILKLLHSEFKQGEEFKLSELFKILPDEIQMEKANLSNLLKNLSQTKRLGKGRYRYIG